MMHKRAACIEVLPGYLGASILMYTHIERWIMEQDHHECGTACITVSQKEIGVMSQHQQQLDQEEN